MSETPCEICNRLGNFNNVGKPCAKDDAEMANSCAACDGKGFHSTPVTPCSQCSGSGHFDGLGLKCGPHDQQRLLSCQACHGKGVIDEMLGEGGKKGGGGENMGKGKGNGVGMKSGGGSSNDTVECWICEGQGSFNKLGKPCAKSDLSRKGPCHICDGRGIHLTHVTPCRMCFGLGSYDDKGKPCQEYDYCRIEACMSCAGKGVQPPEPESDAIGQITVAVVMEEQPLPLIEHAESQVTQVTPLHTIPVGGLNTEAAGIRDISPKSTSKCCLC